MNNSKLFSEKFRINLVYYGPGAAGKTTNLRYIHSHTAICAKSNIEVQQTETYQYLFFDFMLPNMIPTVRIQCFPGSIWDRKACEQKMFTHVNAVVFIADSLADRRDANLEVLEILENHLHHQGYSLNTLPWVMQYNKRDLPTEQILPVHELQRQLNSYDVPYFEAIATQGIGVFETLNAVLQLAVEKARRY